MGGSLKICMWTAGQGLGTPGLRCWITEAGKKVAWRKKIDKPLSITIFNTFYWYYLGESKVLIAQSAAAVEYTECFSAEGLRPPNECPGYDTKQSDGEVPVMLGLWGMLNTPSLPLLPGPFCPRKVAPERALSMA